MPLYELRYRWGNQWYSWGIYDTLEHAKDAIAFGNTWVIIKRVLNSQHQETVLDVWVDKGLNTQPIAEPSLSVLPVS